MSKKQILLINDMAGYGKVATAAMLPLIFAAMWTPAEEDEVTQ